MCCSFPKNGTLAKNDFVVVLLYTINVRFYNLPKEFEKKKGRGR